MKRGELFLNVDVVLIIAGLMLLYFSGVKSFGFFVLAFLMYKSVFAWYNVWQSSKKLKTEKVRVVSQKVFLKK